MGVRYPQQKKLQQKISTYQPQSQKTGTGYGLADPYIPDVGGAVAIDPNIMSNTPPPTPEQQKEIDAAIKRNEEFSKDVAARDKANQNNGALEINPLAGLPGEFGAPSKEQYAAADEYYKGRDYGYDPYKQDRGGMFQEQDFNPYRQAAGNKADLGNAMENQGAYNQLLSRGPVNASDRMQMASDFNRRKITGAFAAAGGANERENQGRIQTGQMNISRGMDVDAANSGAQNTMMRFKEGANESRRLNLYQTQKERELMAKRLKAAHRISGAGGYAGNTEAEILQKILKGE